MPGELLDKYKAKRSDSENSDTSLESVSEPSRRRRVILKRNVRPEPNVTTVERMSSSSLHRPRRLDNDTLVNRYARIDSDEDIDYVTPTVNNSYVSVTPITGRNNSGLLSVNRRLFDDDDDDKDPYLRVERTGRSSNDDVIGESGKSYVTINGGDSRRLTHPSQKPVPPPDVSRNHVWNIVNQFDRESKKKSDTTNVYHDSSDVEDESSSSKDAGGEFLSSHTTYGRTNGHYDMSKTKKNPIANGIKVIFGLRSSRKSEEVAAAKDSTSFVDDGPRSRDFKSTTSSNPSSIPSTSEKWRRNANRLELLKTATENRRVRRFDDNTEMNSRLGGTQYLSDGTTDGYSTSKTFEYLDNRGLEDYDTVRGYQRHRSKHGRERSRGSPAPSDFKGDFPDDESTAGRRRHGVNRSASNLSSKTRLANGGSQYVFKSSDRINRSSREAAIDERKKRDFYKSTGDLEYKRSPLGFDKYGGSQPDIHNKRRYSPNRGYSDDDESTIRSPSRDGTNPRTYNVSTIMEGEADQRNYSSYRAGRQSTRKMYGDSLEKMKSSPSDIDSRPPTREYGTLDGQTRRRSPSRDGDYRSKSSPAPNAKREATKNNEKYRSWERRAKERGSILRVFDPDEPFYSTVQRKNEINSRKNMRYMLHTDGREREDEVRSPSRDSSVNKADDGHTYERLRSSSKKTTNRVDVDRRQNKSSGRQHRAVERFKSKSDRDRSSSRESVQRQVERGYQKQVYDDQHGFKETVEEDTYKDVQLEDVDDDDSDTEEVVDQNVTSKTEEYEKDGQYHKYHKQTNEQTKVSTYTNPNIMEELRRNSKPVEYGDGKHEKRIVERRPDGQIVYQTERRSPIADVKTSIEKSSHEDRYREGNLDVRDKRAVNRAVVETGTMERHNMTNGYEDVIVKDHNDYNRVVDHKTTVDDSDPFKKVRTKSTKDQSDHYRTVEDKRVVEKLEKKAPSLAKSRQQLKQIEAPDKPPRSSSSSTKTRMIAATGTGQKKKKIEDDTIRKYNKSGQEVVYSKVVKSSKSKMSEIDGHASSDDERKAKSYQKHSESRQKDSANSGRSQIVKTTVTETRHEPPVEAKLTKKSNIGGWFSKYRKDRRQEGAGDSSSPSPPLQKRSATLENRKNKNKMTSAKAKSSLDTVERKSVSRMSSKEEPAFHHYKQYKGKDGPAYPSIRITVNGKENGDVSEGGNRRGNKYQRAKLLGNKNMHGSVDRLLSENKKNEENGLYHTLQHERRGGNNGTAMKRSNSTAATMPPVQRLGVDGGGATTPLRTKNHTSSSADSVAGESTTSSKRAVGFYIPAVSHANRKSTEDLSGRNSVVSVSRSQSMLSSSRPGTLKKVKEKTTTYSMAPSLDQVDKEDEIYGSTHVIDYSQEDESAKKIDRPLTKTTTTTTTTTKEKANDKKLKRTASLPKDTRFPWLFRRKKKERTIRTIKE